MKKVKKAVSALVIVLMLVSMFSFSFTSFAASYNGYTYTTSGSSATITGYTGSSASLSIPSKISSYNVTAIADDAFSGNTTITSVTIPSSVTSIGMSAFYDCVNLKTVSLSSSVKQISNATFNGCSALTSITIPSTVTSIGDGTFAYCTSLKTVTLSGSNLTSVGSSAFMGCSSLTSISLPNSVTSIGDEAFAECTSFTSFTIPSSLSTIGTDIVRGCSAIKEFKVSNHSTLKTVDGVLYDSTGKYLLQYPPAKAGAYTIPNTVTTIYNRAFYDCTGITSLTIPSSVTTIGESAFCGCINLATLNFNAKVTVIPASMLFGCSKLSSFTIPSTVTTIADDAFNGCSSLKSITLPSGATTLGSSVFANCTALTTVSLPSSLQYIPSSFFANCSSLKNVSIPSTVQLIDANAFDGCSAITSITLPTSLVKIGSSAFANCTSLTGVTIPASVELIDYLAFYNCKSISSFTVKSGNEYYYATNGVLFNKNNFLLCAPAAGLSGAYTIPTDTVGISDYAFHNCKSVTSITLSANTYGLGYNAFLGCDSLTEIKVNSSNEQFTAVSGVLFNSDKTILYYVPAAKTGSYSIPEGVTSISYDCFNANTQLSSVTIPSTINNIDITLFSFPALKNLNVAASHANYASVDGVLYSKDKATLVFYPAGRTEKVFVIPSTTTGINFGVFYYNTYLEEVVIPNSVTGFSYAAFDPNLGIKICGKTDSTAYKFAQAMGYDFVEYKEIKSVSHEISGSTIKFTVTTYPDSNISSVRVNGSTTASTYTTVGGMYVWTISMTAPKTTTTYTFDAYSKSANAYLGLNVKYDVEVEEEVIEFEYKSVSHTISNNVLTFTVVTSPAKVDRIKLMSAANTGAALATATTHTVNAQGNYVWTISIAAPKETTNYVFDARSSETGAYMNKYQNYKVEVVIPLQFVDVSSTTSGDDVTLIVTTSAADINAVKVVIASNTSTTVAQTTSYTVDGNGNYRWTLTFALPDETTEYRIYAKDKSTNNYITSPYATCTVEVEKPEPEEPIFKSVTHTIADGKITLTIVTRPMAINRVKVMKSNDLVNYVKLISTYTVNADGDYVWVTSFTAPTSDIEYALDVRSSETSKYLEQYAYYQVDIQEIPAEVESVSHKVSGTSLTFTITTSQSVSAVKLMRGDTLGLITLTSNYTNTDGKRVWTITTTAPVATTEYAFDVLDVATGAYTKNYYRYTVEIFDEPVDDSLFKSVTHIIEDGKIIFTVITAPAEINRLKVCATNDLSVSLGVGSTYTVNADGNYVWTVKITAPTVKTSYSFDARSSVTSKYLKEYFEYVADITATPEPDPTPDQSATFKSVSYTITGGKVTVTVVTPAGDYNRVKISLPSAIASYVKYVDKYTVNADGDYVWTLTFDAPTSKTEYALDIRVNSTSKYVKDYYYFTIDPSTAPSVPETNSIFKSATYKIDDGKAIVTITTSSGDYNRIKLVAANALGTSLAVVSKYTVNADGDYVWTLTFDAPATKTEYALDMRIASTGKYVKDYYYFTIDPSTATPEPEPSTVFVSATSTVSGGKLTLTIVTKPAEINRVKVMLTSDQSSYVKLIDKYTVDANGNYVWTATTTAPTETTSYTFDVRSSVTSKYMKDFFEYTAVI